MITRIVRMHFTESGVNDFLDIFHANREAIASFEGCVHLELLKDADDDLVYVTLSHWETAETLERYRKSILFASVWGRVKRLFSAPTEAFSMVAAGSGGEA